MLAHRLLRLFLVTGVCTQSALRTIMAWRSHGRDNADMVRHLKGECNMCICVSLLNIILFFLEHHLQLKHTIPDFI